MELSREYKERLNKALNEVADNFCQMTPEQFAAEIEAHKGGDIANALMETGMFNTEVDHLYSSGSKFVSGISMQWVYASNEEDYNYLRAMAA